MSSSNLPFQSLDSKTRTLKHLRPHHLYHRCRMRRGITLLHNPTTILPRLPSLQTRIPTRLHLTLGIPYSRAPLMPVRRCCHSQRSPKLASASPRLHHVAPGASVYVPNSQKLAPMVQDARRTSGVARRAVLVSPTILPRTRFLRKTPCCPAVVLRRPAPTLWAINRQDSRFDRNHLLKKTSRLIASLIDPTQPNQGAFLWGARTLETWIAGWRPETLFGRRCDIPRPDHRHRLIKTKTLSSRVCPFHQARLHGAKLPCFHDLNLGVDTFVTSHS